MPSLPESFQSCWTPPCFRKWAGVRAANGTGTICHERRGSLGKHSTSDWISCFQCAGPLCARVCVGLYKHAELSSHGPCVYMSWAPIFSPICIDCPANPVLYERCLEVCQDVSLWRSPIEPSPTTRSSLLSYALVKWTFVLRPCVPIVLYTV